MFFINSKNHLWVQWTILIMSTYYEILKSAKNSCFYDFIHLSKITI